MAEYPTPEQLADPNYVWPAEYGAPQDRGEPVPAANPSPGPDSVTEPAPETKEFHVVSVPPSEWMPSSGGKDENGGEPGGALAGVSGGGSTQAPQDQQDGTAHDPSSQPTSGNDDQAAQATPEPSGPGSAEKPEGTRPARKSSSK